MAVPQSQSDRADSDPLLDFLSEVEGFEPPVQPVEQTELPSVVPPPEMLDEPIDPLRERIEKLEQARDDATKEVAELRSQLATLVRATRDIDKRVDRATAPARPAITRPTRYRVVTAIVGMIFGIALVGSLWSYATTNRNPVVVPAVAASPPAPVDPPVPADPPVPTEAIAVRTAESPKVASTTSTPPRQQPQPAPARTGYFGTLSIDASPGGQVLVNGQEAGRTPLRLDNLKAGAHLVWIEREGYRRWTKVVDVAAGRVSRVFADLEPIASR